METAPHTIEEVQANIDRLNAEIAARRAEIERYERMGHLIVSAMYIPTPREAHNG